MNPEKIRDELRHGKTDDMERRRKIMWLSSIGLVDFSIISLYQTGVIKKLPDIPLSIFDSNKVNASKSAYQMGIPDGPISSTLYAVTTVLASIGGSENASRKPVYDVLLGTAIAGNTAGAVYYLYDMIFKQKKICLYCLTGAAVNFASAIIVAPLFLKKLKKLFS